MTGLNRKPRTCLGPPPHDSPALRGSANHSGCRECCSVVVSRVRPGAGAGSRGTGGGPCCGSKPATRVTGEARPHSAQGCPSSVDRRQPLLPAAAQPLGAGFPNHSSAGRAEPLSFIFFLPCFFSIYFFSCSWTQHFYFIYCNVVLRTAPRALHVLGQRSPAEPQPQPSSSVLVHNEPPFLSLERTSLGER